MKRIFSDSVKDGGTKWYRALAVVFGATGKSRTIEIGFNVAH